jgi:hypothetical protein
MHLKNWIYVCIEQGGAVEACWAHNPKVGGSKPPLVTHDRLAQLDRAWDF